MKKGRLKLIAILGVFAVAAVYYYAALPALNIHSADLWVFLMMLLLFALAAYVMKKKPTRSEL